jgi:hypothetical protein
VSPRWNRSVHVRVGPQTLTATLRRAWPRSATLAATQHAFDADVAEATGSVPAKSQNGFDKEIGSVESVLRALEHAAPLRGATLTVELSHALVHLDVVAGDFAGHDDRQLRTIASACVSELLGEDAGDHEVRWQLQSDDRHLLICAIPRPQLLALEQAAAACGLRLGSVQPDFVREWNTHASALKAGPAVFAVTTGTDVAIAWVVDGVISALSAGPLFEASNPSAHPVSESNGAAHERALAVERLDSRIGGLLLRLGLNAHARRTFSPSQPNPLDSLDLLDARVDRLLAGIGQDPTAQSAFVLVTSDASLPQTSRRWSVLGSTGQLA